MGVAPASSPPYQWFETNIANYDFAGDNFPLGVWPNNSNYKINPIIDPLQCNLDMGSGFQAIPPNSKTIYVFSDYHYTNWGWHSFLGYELPYIPGADAVSPTNLTITFDLRGPNAPKLNPDKTSCAGGCGGSCQSPALATASLDRFQVGVAITDTPISYQPP